MEELEIVIAAIVLLNTVILVPMRNSIKRVEDSVRRVEGITHDHERRISHSEGRLATKEAA